MWTFFYFQYGFRSSWSTADLLAVVSDRISRAFNRSGATRAVAIDISKAFDRIWNAGLLHRLKSSGISDQIFGVISSFLSNRRLRVALDGKSSKKYQVNAGVPQGSCLGPTVFLPYINDLPDDNFITLPTSASSSTGTPQSSQIKFQPPSTIPLPPLCTVTSPYTLTFPSSCTHSSPLIFCFSIYILPSSRTSSSIKSTTCNSRFFFTCCATRYWRSANITSCRTSRGMWVNTFEFADKDNNEIVSCSYSFLNLFIQLWIFTWSFVFS